MTGDRQTEHRLTIAEVAVLVLRETDNPAVTYGDTGLVDLIATRARMKKPFPGPGYHTKLHVRVLDALERRPDLFKKHLTWFNAGRSGSQYARVFTLKGHEPENEKEPNDAK